MAGSTQSADDRKILLRVGVRPIAAGMAAFTIGFVCHLCSTIGFTTANTGLGAQGRILSAFVSVEAKSLGFGGTTAGSADFSSRWSALEPPANFPFAQRDHRSEPSLIGSSFGERFALKQIDEVARPQLATAFGERFGGEFEAFGATVRSAAAPSRVTDQRIAAAKSRTTARSSVDQVVPKPSPETRVRVASASDIALPLAYSSTNSVSASPGTESTLRGLTPKLSKPLDPSRTAIYDITSQTVYLPNGRRLEAHSGFGSHMDDPRHVNEKNTGPTPPNIYDLKLRESHFRGVRAIRLIPTDTSKMYGRSGILAHSYLLGPNGQSNGCVSFNDYDAFLEAFLRGEVERLVVVERLDNPPSPITASDWLKDLFRRS